MMTLMAAAARTTATTLDRPTSPARTEGKPKTPLPMMQLTMSAARLQRPMARTNPSLDMLPWRVSVTASLYHKTGDGRRGGARRRQPEGPFAKRDSASFVGLVTLEQMASALTCDPEILKSVMKCA